MIQSSNRQLTVGQCFEQLVRHPAHHLVHRWNWKSALLSATIRGSLFFAANLSAGIRAAGGAMLAEFAFRAIAVGFYSAITEVFYPARPTWLATTVVLIFVPAVAHALEFAIHSLRGTPNLTASIGLSIAFSIVASLFTLFAMRRGVLVVGEDQRSFLEDLRRLPRLIGEFCWLPLRAATRLVAR